MGDLGAQTKPLVEIAKNVDNRKIREKDASWIEKYSQEIGTYLWKLEQPEET